MPYFKAQDGTQLFYGDWGNGNPVVFVASQALSSEIWGPMIATFVEKGFRCVAFDRRGHGRSDVPSKGYDIDTLASDLSTLLKHLDLQGVTLIGHSLGGAEVIRYVARTEAKRVKCVVLMAATAPLLIKTRDNPGGIDRELFDQVRATWIADLPKWVGDSAQGFFARPTSPETASWATNEFLKTNLQAILACSHTNSETDLRADLASFRVPTLFLHGDRDESVALYFGKQAAALVPGSELEVIEGAAHGLFLTDSARVNKAIFDFIDRRSASFVL